MADLGLARLFGNFKKTLGRQLWTGVLQLLTAVLIARSFGPVGNGLYTVALLLPTLLAMLLGLGLAPANIYYIASGQFSPGAVARTTLKLWLVLSGAGSAIGLVLVESYASIWFPGVPPSTLWVALASFPALLFITLAGSIFQGVQDFSLYNISLSIQPLLVVIGVALCYVLGVDAAYLVVAHLSGTVVAATVVSAGLAKVLRRHGGKGGPYGIRTALSYGLKSHLGNIVAFVNYRVDLFLVNYFIDPLAAGVYGIAVQVAEKLWLVSQAVSTVLLPRLSQVSQERDKLAAITSIVTRTTLAFTAVVAIAATATAWYLIPLIFGEDFAAAVVPFLLMLPGIVAGSCVRILSSEISARGRPEVNLYMALFVVGVSIALNVFLIPSLGLAGAAISTSIAYVLNVMLRLFMFRHFTGRPVAEAIIFRRGDVVRLLGAVLPARGAPRP